jgi:hypothetical protein
MLWQGFVILREAKRRHRAVAQVMSIEIGRIISHVNDVGMFDETQRYTIRAESSVLISLFDRQTNTTIETATLFEPQAVLALKEKAIELNRAYDDDKLYLSEINKLNE